MSGEFKAGSKLPREQDLAAKLGLSRNSLREAVRALALIGVLDSRVGDGTYVTSLDADLLLTGMGFVGELLDGSTLLEVHQVRRILEPVATGLAATRLTEEDFLALQACLEQMEEAETTQAFIDADTEFHRIIVLAAGNATPGLADPEPLERDAARASLAHDHRARRRRDHETAPPRHLRGPASRRRRAGERRRPVAPIRGRGVAATGDRERRRRTVSSRPSPSVLDGSRARPRTEAHPEGCLLRGRGAVRRGAGGARPPGDGRGAPRGRVLRVCGTDLHIAHGAMDHRVKIPQVIRARDVRQGRRAGARMSTDFQIGDEVVVRPLDSRWETPADKGISHISRNLKFLGIHTPGAFQSSWTVPAFTLHRLPGRSISSRPRYRAARACLPRRPTGGACRRRGGGGDRRGPIGLLVALVARSRGAG